MSKLANTRCAEVIGIYNASFGTITDLLDCKNNIDKAGREKAAVTQAKLLKQLLMLDPPESVTLYAHSQGGLITQEGVGQADVLINDAELEKLYQQNRPPQNAGRSAAEIKQIAAERTRSRMSNVTVFSFGTAERDWPDLGPHYNRFTNTADPVPKAIAAVQENRGRISEPVNAPPPKRFEVNTWNPIGAHSMDDVYIPRLTEYDNEFPVKRQPNGQCC